jgi:hypothetical protein
LRIRADRRGKTDAVREHFMAGKGLRSVVWFFTMAASLYSGYSVSGIVNESFNNGWSSTRWIPAGIGVYVGFLVLAPRMHALGRSRGYMVRLFFVMQAASCSSSGGEGEQKVRCLLLMCLPKQPKTFLTTAPHKNANQTN